MIDIDIKHYIKYKAALEAIYQQHIGSGHRFYWDAKTDSKVNEISGLSEHLTKTELANQTGWTVMKAAVMLMSNCLGLKDELTEALSRNSEIESPDLTKEEIDGVMNKLSSLYKTLISTELKRTELKESDKANASTMIESVQYEINNELFVEIINHLPHKYFIKWLIYTVNVNVVPFKNDMQKLRDD